MRILFKTIIFIYLLPIAISAQTTEYDLSNVTREKVKSLTIESYNINNQNKTSISKKTIMYTSNGKVEKVFEGNSELSKVRIQFEYQNDKLKKEISFIGNVINSTLYYTYLTNGKLDNIEQENNSENKVSSKYDYNKEGQLKKITTYPANDFKIENYFDSFGHKTQTKIFTPSFLYKRIDYFYDSDNKLIKEQAKQFYKDDSQKQLDFYSIVYKYENNKLTDKIFDNDGIKTIFKYYYNDSGSLIKTESYNSVNVLTGQITYEYELY